jgi:probable phosphoglycerate mutase
VADLYLIRHGEAAASWAESADPGLSDLGRRQAEAVAENLHDLLDADTHLVSSPLARAQETAQPLARRLGRSVEVNDVFSEIPSPVPLPQRQEWLRQFMRERWAEQGEALRAWRQAALTALLRAERSTAIFTHFLVINAVAGHVLGREETLCFWPDNASVTHLRLQGDSLLLVSLGKEMHTTVN